MHVRSQNPTATALRYDRTTVILHWATAILVALLWLSAQVIDAFPRGPARVNMRSVHMTMGVLLACVVACRVSWRSLSGARLPPAGSPTQVFLSRGVHLTLYALLIAGVLLGFANAWVRGESWFNLFAIPAFDPSNRLLKRQVNGLHDLAANTILIVAGVHAAAALWHHYVWKDGVLRRMLPSHAPRAAAGRE